MYGHLAPARYRNLVIREHLVSQYLLGTLSPKTRKRLESLMAEDESWYEVVMQWHSRLSGLGPMTSDKPPSWVWKNIQTTLGQPAKPVLWTGLWQRKWPTLSLTCAVLLLLFSSTMLFVAKPQIAMPSYIAVMSSAEETDHFVLMAYKGDKPGESSIRLKWNARHQSTDAGMETAMLWVRNKDTGQTVLLGRFTDLTVPKLLTPTEWNTVKNSSELFITANNNPESKVLFKGTCIELSASTV
ncbi:hypothetical protein [Yersinia intermedia]|uniref:hypothetical protein n=1 Tax=Yersinia intermedia TaxID=631 RepID=UPI0005DC2BB0|nr:hypothetical protein [Yersinia intermedia]CNE01938.1 Uncharacterized protein conserved in bacteria [Yersinia intermedia]